MVKIITGPRRSGKSWILSHIFTDYLLQSGIDESQIIHISFDMDDEDNQTELLDPQKLNHICILESSIQKNHIM